MGSDDRLADGQTQPYAFLYIRRSCGGSIEYLEDVRNILLQDSFSSVLHLHYHILFCISAGYLYLFLDLCVLHSVFKKIVYHLLNKLCIHAYQDEVFRSIHLNMAGRKAFLNMAYSAAYYLLHGFHFLVDNDLSILKPGKGENILHKILEPVCILIYSLKKALDPFIPCHVHKHFGGTHDS